MGRHHTLLRKHTPFNSAPARDEYVKRRFQAEVLLQLTAADAYNHEHVLRRKLARWNFGLAWTPPGILARRSTVILNVTLKLVPLRVALVLFRAWLNGWCTARRYQVKQAPCLLGCLPCSEDTCQDSIEHYACCPIVRHFASHMLHLPDHRVGGSLNFLCLQANVDDETRTMQLLMLYAVYTATNCLRFVKPKPPVRDMNEFLLQYVHQGANQSPAAQKMLRQQLAYRNVRRRRA